MKNKYYILSLGLLAMMSGCTDEATTVDVMPEKAEGITRIYATIADDIGETRALLVNDKKVTWEEQDSLSVIPIANLSISHTFKYQSDGYFDYSDITGIAAGNYYGVYPKLNWLGGDNTSHHIYMKLQENVEYAESNFSQELPLFASSTSLPTNHFTFYPTAGILKISLSGSLNVTKMTLRGNNNEQLAGFGLLDVTNPIPTLTMNTTTLIHSVSGDTLVSPAYQQVMTMGSGVQLSESSTGFYFVVPSATYTKGFTIIIEAVGLDIPIVKTTTNSIAIGRGQMVSFTSVDTDDILVKESDSQVTALKALYTSLGGASWTTKKWDTTKSITDATAWPGVTIDANGLVTAIDLSDNGLSGTIPAEIGDLKNLVTLNLSNNSITGGIPKEVKNMSSLVTFNVSNNLMNGSVPYAVYTSDVWAYANKSLAQSGGKALNTKYVSNDYTNDNAVVKLQSHTLGTGIPLVITCEGFTDDMVGLFTTEAAKAKNAFFEIAPYSHFKNYFDVYTMMAVSPNNEVDLNLAYGTRYTTDSYEIDFDKVKTRLMNMVEIGNTCNDVLTIVLLNDNGTGHRARCWFNTDGTGAALIPLTGDDDNVRKVIHHEAGGHGFAFLADEYVSAGATATFTDHTGLVSEHNIGWSLNLDDTNNSSEVIWTDFWGGVYAAESVGAYEGGGDLYKYGIYHSTPQSTMNDQNAYDKFNPISRWAIFKEIYRRAGLVAPTVDDFKSYDATNSNISAPPVAVVPRTRNYVEKEDYLLGAPPVKIMK